MQLFIKFHIITGAAVSALCLVFIISCNKNQGAVPFQGEETDFIHPRLQPVLAGSPKEINWPDPLKIQPEKNILDIDKLPSSVYDSMEHLPFKKRPDTKRLVLDSLPGRNFDMASVPTKHFQFRTSLLEPSISTSVDRPRLISGSSSLLYEFPSPLLGKNIRYVLTDKSGFLWIANDQGLYRYDGEDLLRMVSGSQLSIVQTMAEDHDGRIWIGTEGNGVWIIDQQSGTYIHLTRLQGLNCDDVNGILMVKGGMVWLTETSLANQKGIDIINLNARTIKHIGVCDGLSSEQNISAVQDDEENIWISHGGDYPIDIIDIKAKKIIYIKKTDGTGIETATALLKDKKGRIWIGGLSGKISVIDHKNATIIQYGEEQGLKNNIISTLMEDRQGRIWIGTGLQHTVVSGVEILNPDEKSLKFINTSVGLSANDIQRFSEDRLGQIWIATVNGLNMVNKGGYDILHIGKADMYCLAQDTVGSLWICTPNQGIQLLNLSTGLAKSITETQGLHSNRIQNDFEMKGRMYVSTRGGLEIFDPPRKAFGHIGLKQGLSSDKIGAMYKDRLERIWMGFFPPVSGVDVLDMKDSTIIHLGKANGLDSTIIMEIRQDSSGIIWLAHVNGVIDLIDPDKKTISKLLFPEPLTRSTLSDMSMVADKYGNMWVGTDRGVSVVNARKDSFVFISTEQGLAGNYILSLNSFDNQIYVGTMEGLTILTPSIKVPFAWTVESFYNVDGFRKLIDNFSTDFINAQGRFFWTDLGITYFKAPNIKPLLPKTYVTGVHIFNQPVVFIRNPWRYLKDTDTIWRHDGETYYLKDQLPKGIANAYLSDQAAGPYNLSTDLTLSYDSNHIAFQFSLGSAGVGETPLYRYILEGVDKTWSESSQSAVSPTYLNLRPGHYIFKVCGKLKNSDWSIPAVFKFTISTPWWQTPWFYLLCALIVFSGFYLFYRYRIRQILKLQHIRNSIAADLHDDIGSTLSSISIMSELAKEKSPGSVILLDSIGESAAQIQENMRDLVWAVNPKNDSFSHIIQRMRQFAVDILEAKQISFTFTYGPDIIPEKLSMGQRKKIYLFFKEAINNAAKHSGASAVHAEIRMVNRMMHISIADNGTGFCISEAHSGNGIINLRQRAFELGGQVAFHSVLQEGTKIELSFKIA